MNDDDDGDDDDGDDDDGDDDGDDDDDDDDDDFLTECTLHGNRREDVGPSNL